MPFEGPQGQGPFRGHADCVDSLQDEDGISDADALCAAWERQANDAATKLRFDELDRSRLLQAAAEHPGLIGLGDESATAVESESMPDAPADAALTARQKQTAAVGFDVVAGPGSPLPTEFKYEAFDPENPPDEFAEQIEADDFVVYGIANIQKHDIEGQRISAAALEAALDRFFGSEDAPGIISRGHADVPVGMPVREHTLDEDTTLVIDGQTYEFDAGETLRTEVKDANDDQLPELWLVSRLANDSDIARETRYKALTGELNGFSVTVKPKRGAVEQRSDGKEDVLAVDLHAVTIGTDEQIKNKGSEFDVAEVKALARARDAPGQMAGAVRDKFSRMTQDPDEKSVLGRLLQRAGEDLESEADAQTEQKADDDDADDDDDEEPDSKADPIDAALEGGALTAAEAADLRPVASKMGEAGVQTLVDAISENDLDVADAVDLMEAYDGDGMADEDGADGAAQMADTDGDGDAGEEQKADTDADGDSDAAQKADADADADGDGAGDDSGVEQKASPQEVAEAMADRFDIPVDEVLEHLDQLDQAAEKDDAGELKAAARAAAEEYVDEVVDAKLDERLPDEPLTEETFEQKLEAMTDSFDDEILTKAEFNDLIQEADVVASPIPAETGGEAEQTLGDSLPVAGGDD